MINTPSWLTFVLAMITLISPITVMAEATNASSKSCTPRYVFSWNLTDDCLPKPRGGTTTGAPVTLALEPSQAWVALQEEGLSQFERDRRAILAMAGAYRASFEFLETIGFTPNYSMPRPYQSWGTEYIYVVEDRGDFISLQHIMVMYFQEGDSQSKPMVMKHWRQDWQYRDREILEYTGHQTWTLRKLAKSDVEGTWSQTVYQVDDSPRYASYGAWTHNTSFSSWQSQSTWRPLPRRESSVRDDYDLLEGFNRHTILATGWVHEEENLKREIRDNIGDNNPNYVAKELGNNRYQRVTNVDFSPGDQYWQETGPFWKIVRQAWAKRTKQHSKIKIAKSYENTPMFMAIFKMADDFRNGTLKATDTQNAVAKVLDNYVKAVN